MTAWQGTPLGPGKPYGRGTEPDPQHGAEATRSALLCFSWVVLGLCSECCCKGGGTSLRTKAVGNTVEHILCSWSCWDVWLPSYSKGDVLLCLGSLEGVGCAAAPISGHGKTHRHPPARPGSSGLRGLTWQWGHPMRVCILHCTPLLIVREEDFPQCVTRVPPMPASLPFGGT